MSTLIVLSPLPTPLVSQWLSARLGRSDFHIIGAGEVSEPELAQALGEAELLLGDYTFQRQIDEAFLASAPRLKFVQQPSVGYQHIDLEACRRRGVQVANTPGVNDAAVAEHTLMLALMLLRHALFAHNQTSAGAWAQQELLWNQGVYELNQKTYGIVGMGRIGRELAKRLHPFGTRTIYFDVNRLPAETEAELHVQYKPLDHLLRLADVVSLHVPLTDATRGLIGAKELALMKFSAILINVARGECVDEAALAQRLREKKLAGAGLDVFSHEPIATDNPLLGQENVVLTPHIAGATAEVRQRVVEMAVGNVARVLGGEAPRFVLNA
ncbi:MAG: 2-hydroxyacid dehydrogenase [Pirellulales bacterium]|nr:2-hydroxyacid dehydrogenase [Pirellulales bacterium]